MKSKVIIKPKKEFEKWIELSNFFAQSMISRSEALKQFNDLDALTRVRIRQQFNEYDKIRRAQIPNDEAEEVWKLSVMVDAHIIATEYNIDPLTAVMCIAPPCKINERVFFK